ncbi:MAG TPA: hypothetical protein VK399_17595 [Longimicrobiaceae bacterium]|jgi:hypothetical protein|nr:hypothetical protein [Longimicrobiaceae bacterium]
MRRTRFFISASSMVAILAGAFLLSTPQPASAAAFDGCSQEQIQEATTEGSAICGGRGGSGVITCYEDGSWDWNSINCNPRTD